MAIKKQEFYEGAALHLIIRNGGMTSILYEAPFFLMNEELLLYLKYSTKGRSPWSFTFMPDEQRMLSKRSYRSKITLGLVCGSDGVAALGYDAFATLATIRGGSVHIACYRHHGEHYEVNGPDGTLPRKIAPSTWQKLLER